MIKYALRDLIEVGQLFKTSGIQGHIIGELIEPLEPFLNKIDYLFIARNGQSIPYFLENIEWTNNMYFKFEDVDSPEHAQFLMNTKIYLDVDKLSILKVDLSKSSENLEGFKLYNKGKMVGIVDQIVEYPGQTVLVIQDLKGVVIPLVEEWILEIDMDKRELKMDFFEELLNIND